MRPHGHIKNTITLHVQVFVRINTWMFETCFDETHPAIDQTTYMDARKKYHKTARTSIREDKHLDVRNMCLM